MERLYISYPEFKLGEIIDPEEANTNNSDISFKVNEAVDRLNSLLGTGNPDDPDGGFIELTIRGNIVKINPIEPFPADNVEDFLNQLMGRLYSSIVTESGASLIRTPEIEGISGTTVEAQLKALHELITFVEEDGEEEAGALLEQHKASGDHDERYYTKTESDENVSDLTIKVEDAVTAIEVTKDRVDKITEQIAPGEKGVVISKIRVVLEDPVDATTGEIWMIGQEGEETILPDPVEPDEPEEEGEPDPEVPEEEGGG